MSLRYKLPCPSCDHVFELVTKQAGQELTCPSCKAVHTAPKLGTLRQLETVGTAGTEKSANPNLGRTKNSLFVAGLAIALIAGAAAFGLFRYGQSMLVEYDVDAIADSFDSWMDERKPSEVVGVLQQLQLEEGLGDWNEQPHVASNRQGTILVNTSYGLMGLSGMGLVLLISSFFAGKSGK